MQKCRENLFINILRKEIIFKCDKLKSKRPFFPFEQIYFAHTDIPSRVTKKFNFKIVNPEENFSYDFKNIFSYVLFQQIILADKNKQNSDFVCKIYTKASI